MNKKILAQRERERERESKKFRYFIKFLFIIIIFFAIHSSVSAESYYMRANGVATKANSAASAPTPGGCGATTTSMSVATHNAATFLAGDTIYLCDSGGSFTAQITPPSSGTDDTHRITYDAAPGASPVVDLGGLVNYGFWIFQKSYITVRYITMQNPLSGNGVFVIQGTGTATNNNIGEYLNLSSSNGIVVFIAGNNGSGNILRHSTVTASNVGGNSAIRALSPYTTIDDVTVLNTSGQKSTGYGIAVGNNGIVQNSLLGRTSPEAFFTGIFIDGVSNAIIQNNEIAYSWNGLPYGSGGLGMGIQISNTSSSNNIVRYNKIHDNQRGYIETGTTGTGNNSIYYNYFYNNTTNAIDIRYAGSTGYAMVYNNTIIHHIDLGSHVGHGMVIQNGGTRAKFFNNLVTNDIFQNDELIQAVELAQDITKAYTDVQLSNNLYYVTNGAKLGTSLTATSFNLPDWISNIASDAFITVKETGSQEGNPIFFDASANNYKLQSTSPAINAGTDVSLTTDYVGNPIVGAPDVGAFEFQAPVAPTSLAQYKSDGTTAITSGDFTGESTVTLKFDMSSINLSDSFIPQIEIQENGTAFTNVVTNSGDAVAYSGTPVNGVVTVTGLITGTSYHWQARISNSAGQSSWVAMGGSPDFQVDITSPTLSFTDPVSVGPSISNTISADWGDATVKKWDYDTDGTCSSTAGDYNKTDADSMDQVDQTNNTKFICLYGEDALGNKSELVSTNTINIDITDPTSTISTPTDNSSSNSTTVALTGTSFDTNLSSTTISVDGAPFVATSGTASSWTYSATSLSEGAHTFQSKGTDTVGHTGLSSIINVTVDTQAPSTAIASPTAGTYHTAQSVSLSAVGSNSIRYSITATPADCASGTLYITPISVSSSETIYVRACDALNNSSTTSFLYVISHISSGSYLPGYGTNTTNGTITNPVSNIVIPSSNSSSISEIQKVIKDLKYGMTNKDVKTLQLFLIAQDKGINAKALAKHGATNYFGKLTKASLAEWQKVNNIKPAVGYFGKVTRAKIKLLNL